MINQPKPNSKIYKIKSISYFVSAVRLDSKNFLASGDFSITNTVEESVFAVNQAQNT